MYRLTGTGPVVRLDDGALIPDDPKNSDWVEFQAWCESGNEPEPAPEVDPFPALGAALRELMDNEARALGFEDILTASTFADESAVPRFQHAARALRQWRSECRDTYEGIVAQVQSGARALPTPEEMRAELPSFQGVANGIT